MSAPAKCFSFLFSHEQKQILRARDPRCAISAELGIIQMAKYDTLFCLTLFY